MQKNAPIKDHLSLFMVHYDFPKINLSDFPSFIQHIQAGCDITKKPLNMLKDNTGDNISDLNNSFGELTAQYWVWKHVKAPFVGFQHYRRIFNFNPAVQLKHANYPISFKYCKKVSELFLNEKFIIQSLNNYDLIIPRPQKLRTKIIVPTSIEDYYCLTHHADDWHKMMDYLPKKLSPSYKKYLNIFSESTELYACIIYVASYEVFNDMMAWLFDILFDLNKILDIRNNSYQRRSIAFLAERLLHLYYHQAITEKRLRVQVLDYALLEDRSPNIKEFLNMSTLVRQVNQNS